MILVFGGTTEGRIAVSALDEGDGKYFYSTVGEKQDIECGHGSRISGAMTPDAMYEFCKSNGIRLIIDAAHPFAVGLHHTVGEVASRIGLPVVRLERNYECPESEYVVMCDDYADAMVKMKDDGVSRLLALTGVNTLPKLAAFWKETETFFRILDREESREKVREAGFPMSKVVYYVPDSTYDLIGELHPDAIITKESGNSGGFEEKISAALRHGVKTYVVRHPVLSPSFITVTGRHGLRRAVEKILPEFYSLHTGFTTGSCATAAAKAALLGLLTGEKVSCVDFRIPEGEIMEMSVADVAIMSGSACATVIKDAGDDPDVTDKCEISAKVSYASHDGIRFFGGEGIGTVTLPGLGINVGEPAINPVPRRMMETELSALYQGGLDVTISLKDGMELADKTFNPRVGVKGGMSIIGTTGIVHPFSHEAFIETIRREMDVAKAFGCSRVVINSGGRSERFLKSLYDTLPPQAFVQYGNAIGETMEIAEDLNIENITIGLMIGKAVKLAEGNMDTHSHKTALNKSFLMYVAEECGCSQDAVKTVAGINLARDLWNKLSIADADKFFPALLSLCLRHCSKIYHGCLEGVLISDDGEIRYCHKQERGHTAYENMKR
ncbi:MAG: cobalt-precorrin-5B (C(1))-methyltransferase CbiD [Muribaculaceae bacterium]|nr:cobalt-precorrin-5B (C(1))-methyltransferase CbiD [Muribaculaceae bacterium]